MDKAMGSLATCLSRLYW